MEGHDIPAVGRGADVTIGPGSDGSYIALGVAADLESRTLAVRLMSSDDGRESDEVIASLDWSPGASLSIPFEFSVEGTGTVVRVNGRDIRFGIGSDATSEVRFGCTGGSFLFSGLETSP